MGIEIGDPFLDFMHELLAFFVGVGVVIGQVDLLILLQFDFKVKLEAALCLDLAHPIGLHLLISYQRLP